MLHKKDLLFGFHEPVSSKSTTSEFDLVVTMYTKKTQGKSVAYRLDVFPNFIKNVKFSCDRLSVRFDGNSVYFVFDVPVDSGIPFYKVSKGSDRNRRTLYNADLVKNIFETMALTGKTKAYFNLEKTADVGSLSFYELVLKETQI